MSRLLSCKMKAIINIYITLQAIILKTDQQSQNICQLEIYHVVARRYINKWPTTREIIYMSSLFHTTVADQNLPFYCTRKSHLYHSKPSEKHNCPHIKVLSSLSNFFVAVQFHGLVTPPIYLLANGNSRWRIDAVLKHEALSAFTLINILNI